MVDIHTPLQTLASATSRAVTGALGAWASEDDIAELNSRVFEESEVPVDWVDYPVRAVSVEYEGGLFGGGVFLASPGAARRLSAAYRGEDVAGVAASDGPLTDDDTQGYVSAIRDVMTAVVDSTADLMGEPISIGSFRQRALASAEQARELITPSSYSVCIEFEVFGESCVVMLLVPHTFCLRMNETLQAAAESTWDTPAGEPGERDAHAGIAAAVRNVPVRVWAEFGRRRMTIEEALRIPMGEVLQLDARMSEPIRLYANGAHFADARLAAAPHGGAELVIERLVETAPGSTVPGHTMPLAS